MKICSMLIPSRGRLDMLVGAIESINNTSDSSMVDVWLKFDDDDNDSLARLSCLSRFPNVQIVIGPRLGGYGSTELFCERMARASCAKWICIFNDDAILQGAGWDTQLAALPTEGVIAQPEIYGLGASKYPRCATTAFPFVPNGCWRAFGQECIPHPSDAHFPRLAMEHGWTTHFLKGLVAQHNRTGTVPA